MKSTLLPLALLLCLGQFASAADKPNLIWIMADDKYQSAGPKAQKLRETAKRHGFSREFKSPGITANSGELRAINYTLLHCRQISEPARGNWIACV